jgi:hypothetical protein
MEVAAAVLLGLGAYEYFKPTATANSSEVEITAGKIPQEELQKIYDLPANLSNQEIVDKVMDGSIPKLDYENFDYAVLPEDEAESQEFVDENREIKDICTDMVVNLFLESSASNFNFLKKVYETFEESITYYRQQKELPAGSLILVYKGGNVLRIISNEFLRELPGSAAFEIQEYYKNFFKRSDADFSIYVDPHLENYQRVYDDMITLGFTLQRKLRQEFMQNKTKYFDFYKYSNKYKAQSLDPYFKKMRSMNALSNPENETFYNKQVTDLVFEDIWLPRDLDNTTSNTTDTAGISSNDVKKYVSPADKGIQFDKDNNGIVVFEIPSPDDVGTVATIGTAGSGTDNSIYVQSNETLDFEAGGKVKFALVRSKFAFNVYLDDVPVPLDPSATSKYSVRQTGTVRDEKNRGSQDDAMKGQGKVMKNIGGELIDLSYPHKDDAKIDHFYENLSRYLHRYELRNNDDKIEFNSYSLVYLIEDLEFILFKFVQKPWDAPKYEKRLNRLFYLYMIDIFNKVRTNPQRREILLAFTELFNTLMITPIDKMEKVINNFENENEEKHRFLLINNLLVYLRDLVRILRPVDIPSFRDFLGVLLDNTKVILDSFRNLGEYCSIDGAIRLKNIYEGDFRSLV